MNIIFKWRRNDKKKNLGAMLCFHSPTQECVYLNIFFYHVFGFMRNSKRFHANVTTTKSTTESCLFFLCLVSFFSNAVIKFCFVFKWFMKLILFSRIFDQSIHICNLTLLIGKINTYPIIWVCWRYRTIFLTKSLNLK